MKTLGRIVRWRWTRPVASAVVLTFAGWYMSQQLGDLDEAVRRLSSLRWSWVVAALFFEAASMVVFALLQRRLLRAGRADVPYGALVAIVVAGDTMAGTLPGGIGWAAAWVFEQLGRRGVDRFLRVWMFLVAGAVSSFALFLVLAAGAIVAGGRGPVAGLRWLVWPLISMAVLGAAGICLRRTKPVRRMRDWIRTRVLRDGRAARISSKLATRLGAVRLEPSGWVEVLALALTNWLVDAAVLVCGLQALHVAVPWRGVLVAYALTQIAGALPISFGGLGVVTVSLTALLTAYGIPSGQAIAAVVIYRLVSFWALVPVGWLLWLVLDTRTHRFGRTASPPLARCRDRSAADRTVPAAVEGSAPSDGQRAPDGRRAPDGQRAPDGGMANAGEERHPVLTGTRTEDFDEIGAGAEVEAGAGAGAA